MGSIQPFRSLLLLFIRESHVAATPHQHEVQLSTQYQIIPTSHVLFPFLPVSTIFGISERSYCDNNGVTWEC